jgi:hypothetical protein
MKFKPFLPIFTLCLLSSLSNAQDSPMSASAGLGPGNSFTLFIEFQKPMKVQNIDCAFDLQGAPKSGQEDFGRQVRCAGAPTKDDDTHYRVKVEIPQVIAAGDYKLAGSLSQWTTLDTSTKERGCQLSHR